MKAVILIPLAALAACASPHPLSGLRDQVTVDAGGYSFAINYSQDRAEVTRLTRVWRPDYADVQAAAVAAELADLAETAADLDRRMQALRNYLDDGEE